MSKIVRGRDDVKSVFVAVVSRKCETVNKKAKATSVNIG